tara:strand:+ start:241 stop:465 length:225 start_codon:yes stop_codon:yes gene_type:complete
MKTEDKEDIYAKATAKAEAEAQEAAKKLFATIRALVFPSEHSLDLTMLAKKAIVTAYREGLEHGYKFVVPPTVN